MSNHYPFNEPSTPSSEPYVSASAGIPSERRTFFDALRYSGFVRSEPRVVGGVLAGLSRKWGFDRTLIRVLFAIAAFFFPILVCAYALAWAFLPEERDGRIHAQSLVLGHFDIAQLGAIALFTVGAANSATYSHIFFGVGVLAVLFPVVLIAGVVLAIGLAAKGGKNPSQPPVPAGVPDFAAAPAPTPDGEGAQSAVGADFAAKPFVPNIAAPQSTPAWSAPYPLVKPRRVPTWVDLLVTGLLVVVFAGVLFTTYYTNITHIAPHRAILIGGGVCLLIVAIPLAIAALKDRAAYWLTALSIIGALLAFPVTVGGLAAAHDSRARDFVLSDRPHLVWEDRTFDDDYFDRDDYFDHDDMDKDSHFDFIVKDDWDLTNLPSGQTKFIEVDNVLGELTIRVREDQPVEIRVESLRGSIIRTFSDHGNVRSETYADGMQHNRVYRSVPGAAPVAVIELESVMGEVEIVEVPVSQSQGSSSSRVPADSVSQSGQDSPQSLSAERSQSGASR